MKLLKGCKMYNATGNHNPWRAAPSYTNELFGLPYAVKKVSLPNRYYSLSRKNWHFIVLDGNSEGIAI